MTGTVLVTGGGGFVGSAVVRKLVHWINQAPARFWDGVPVTEICAVLRPGSSDHRLRELDGLGKWRIERVDVAKEGLAPLLAQSEPKAVLHLAFDATGFSAQPEEIWRKAHLDPLTEMFEILSGKATRIVHTSSAWVLAAGTRLSELSRVAPRLEHARTKARLDEALPALGQRTGVNWINLRLFNVFGRYEHRTRLLPHLVASLRAGVPAQLSHGDQIRDFNDVDDIADAYLRALVAPDNACNALYHVGSGVGTSVREFANAVMDELGCEGLVEYNTTATRDQEIACLVADPTRAVMTLGWRPAPDLRRAISRAAHWWQSHPGQELREVAR